MRAILAALPFVLIAFSASPASAQHNDNFPRSGPQWYEQAPLAKPAVKIKKKKVAKRKVKRAYARNVFRSYQSASTSRTCLTADTKAVLDKLEDKFGKVKIVSTCRKGAVIAGTRAPSQHRYGKAVDFDPPKGRKSEVVKWLYHNNRGLVMTYARMSHVHFDTGQYHAIACGGCGRTHYASARKRHRYAAVR